MLKILFLSFLVLVLIVDIYQFVIFWLRPREERDAYIVRRITLWRIVLAAVSLFFLFFSIAAFFFGFELGSSIRETTIAASAFGGFGIFFLLIALFLKKIYTYFYGITFSSNKVSQENIQSGQVSVGSVSTLDAHIKIAKHVLLWATIGMTLFAGLFFFNIISTNTDTDRMFMASLYLFGAAASFVLMIIVPRITRFISRILSKKTIE